MAVFAKIIIKNDLFKTITKLFVVSTDMKTVIEHIDNDNASRDDKSWFIFFYQKDEIKTVAQVTEQEVKQYNFALLQKNINLVENFGQPILPLGAILIR